MVSSARCPAGATAAARDDRLDLLRGAAVLLVVLFHIALRLPVEATTAGRLLPHEVFSVLFRSGYYAVVVFFVISGYLITTSALGRWGALERVAPGRFYGLRLARIGPCLAALVALLVVLHLLGIEGFVVTTVPLGRAVLAAATFHVNWLEAQTGYLPGAWDVLWSLSVEEGFYLLFPLACRLPGRRTFVALLFVFIMAGPIARAGLTDDEIWADKAYLSGADAIAFGCLAALARRRIVANRRLARCCLALASIGITLVFVFRREAAALGLAATGLNVTVLAAGIALLLAARPAAWAVAAGPWVWLGRPLRGLGRNSYEVYLSHMLVITPLAPWFARFGQPDLAVPLGFVVLVILGGLAGALIARHLSEPLNLAIRRRLAPAPARTAFGADRA
ncbi:O-acetyltransferase OatA [bacterium YEK0313]|nr:O-acetyltransferase OatA [bacterium YEK0313]